MSSIALPLMRRYGYSDRLSTGAVAAGGTLGILIPPSVIMVIYGSMTETSIGKLFIAGIVPGLLGAACTLLSR
jgi:TRAP-type C4-dicarboxylate transport system permease large subunit